MWSLSIVFFFRTTLSDPQFFFLKQVQPGNTKTKWEVVTAGVSQAAQADRPDNSRLPFIGYRLLPGLPGQLPKWSSSFQSCPFRLSPLSSQCNSNDFLKRYISACHLLWIKLFSGHYDKVQTFHPVFKFLHNLTPACLIDLLPLLPLYTEVQPNWTFCSSFNILSPTILSPSPPFALFPSSSLPLIMSIYLPSPALDITSLESLPDISHWVRDTLLHKQPYKPHANWPIGAQSSFAPAWARDV